MDAHVSPFCSAILSLLCTIVSILAQPNAPETQTAGLLSTFSLAFKDSPGRCCGFAATYYPSPNFILDSSSTSSLIPIIDFSLDSSIDVLPSPVFSLRYFGLVKPSLSMVYTFHVGLSEDFAHDRFSLFIGTSYVLNFSSSAPSQFQSATIRFPVVDLSYSISLEYKHTQAGKSGLKLMWKSDPQSEFAVLGQFPSQDVFQPYLPGLEIGFPRNGRILCEYINSDGLQFRLKVLPKGSLQILPYMNLGAYHQFSLYSRVSVAGQYSLQTSILHKNGLYVSMQEDDPIRPYFPPFVLVQPSEVTWPQAITEMYAQDTDMLALYENVALRMYGYLATPITSVYTFYFGLGSVAGTQRMSFWLEDRWLLNSSIFPIPATSVSCTIELSSDQVYPIEIRYFSIDAPTFMTIDWVYGSRSRARVPSEFLYSSKIPQKQVNVTFVANSSACATRSTAYGSALSLMTAGRVARFSIAVKDHVGNKIAVSFRSGVTRLEYLTIYSALFVQGLSDSVSQTSTSGRGSGVQVLLAVDASKYLSAAIVSHGNNYAIGDTITFDTANTAVGSVSSPAVVFVVEETGGDVLSPMHPIPVSVRWMLSDGGCTTEHQCRFSKGTVTVSGPSDYQVTLRAPQTSSTVFYDRYRTIPSMFAIDLLECCGFSATYYASSQTTSPSLAAGIRLIDYSQAGEFWAATSFSNSFRSRYIGMLHVSISELFTFYVSVTTSSDKYQLVVDNLIIIDKMSSPPSSSESQTIFLTCNNFYEVRLNYQHQDLSQTKLLKLELLSSSTGSKHTIGSRPFEIYKPYPLGVVVGFSDGVAATYYSDVEGKFPSASMTQASVDWSSHNSFMKQPFVDAYDDGVFSARFSGIFKPTIHGVYTFTIVMGSSQQSSRISINNQSSSFSSSVSVVTATYYSAAAQDPIFIMIDYRTENNYRLGARFSLSFAADNSWMQALKYTGEMVVLQAIGMVDQTNTQAPISVCPLRASAPDPNFDWQHFECPRQVPDSNPKLLDRMSRCHQQFRSGYDLDVGGQIIFESSQASSSSVSGAGITICTASVSCFFTTTVLDRFQNSRTTGNDFLELALMQGSPKLSSFSIVSLTIFPRKTADDYISNFLVTYVPQRHGNLDLVIGVVKNVSSFAQMHPYSISFNGTRNQIFVQIAHLIISVMPTWPKLFSNFSYFLYPTVFTAGIPSSISLVAFDEFQNPVTSVQSSTSIFVCQPHFLMILGKHEYRDLLSSQVLASASGADKLAWDQTRSFSGSRTLQSSTYNSGSNSYSFSITQATKSGTYRVLCGIAITSGNTGPNGFLGNGLSATFYNDEQGEYLHSSYLSDMPHDSMDFVWNFKRHQGPDPSNSLDKDGYFSIRYAGYLALGGSSAAGYTFAATVGHVNQYVRVLLDGVSILDKWTETWAGLSKSTGLIGAAESLLYPFDISERHFHMLDIFWSSRSIHPQDDETSFKLQLKVNGQHILKTDMFPRIDLQCPDIMVVPAAICASTSTRYLKSSVSTVTAGSPFQVLVSTKDSYNNPIVLRKQKLTPGLISSYVHMFVRPVNSRISGTFASIPGISTKGTGSGAEFLVKIDAASKHVQVNLTAMGKGYAVGDMVTIPSNGWFGGSDIIWRVACVQFNGGLCGRIEAAINTPAASSTIISSMKGSIVSVLPFALQTDPYWHEGTYILNTTCIDSRYLSFDTIVSCKGSGAQLKVVIDSKAETCNTPNSAGSVACSGKISWVLSVEIAAVGFGYDVGDILVVQASSLGVNVTTSPSSRNINITVQTVVNGNGAVFSIVIDSSSNMFVDLLNPGTNYSKFDTILVINPAFGSLNMTVLEVFGDISQAISPVYASAASLGCSVLSPKTGLTKLRFSIKKSSNFIEGTLNSVSQTSTSGRGSGARVSLAVDASKYLSAAIVSHGNNYAIGDTVTFDTANTDVGSGSSPAVVFVVEEIGGAFLSATCISNPAIDWVEGTHLNVTGSTSGLGSGAQFTIRYQNASPSIPAISFFATAVGFGYKSGDTITIVNNPATSSNPLILLVDSVSSIPSCPPVLKTIALESGSCANCPSVLAGYSSFSDSDVVVVDLNPTVSGAYQVETAIGIGQGLLATFYFHNTPDVSSYPHIADANNLVIIVPGVDFSVSSGHPFPSSCKSARFRGFVFPSQAAMYTFYLIHKSTNDRAKLWIDGILLFDSWDSNPLSLEFSATFVFHSASIPFDLHLIYRQVGISEPSQKGLTLKWEHVVPIIANFSEWSVLKSVIARYHLAPRYDISRDTTNADSQISVYVKPAEIDSSSCVAQERTSSGARSPDKASRTAGIGFSFSVTCKDVFSNAIGKSEFFKSSTASMYPLDSYGSGSIYGLTSTNAFRPQFIKRGAGVNADTWSVHVHQHESAGVHQLSVLTAGGSHIFSSPFEISVFPSSHCASRSSVSGHFLSAFSINSFCTFSVMARDRFFNKLTSAASNAVVIASVTQRTSNDKMIYITTSLSNRRPLQVSPLATQPAFISDDVAQYDMKWLSTSPSAQLLGNFPALQIAYAGITGPIESYKILATYYASASSVVIAVPIEGIFAATTRLEFDTSIIHSVVSLAAGMTISAIPLSLTNDQKCGVRLRGFIRGPLSGSSVYTFTMALLANTDRARAWVDNILVIDNFETSAADIKNPVGTVTLPFQNHWYDLLIEYRTTVTSIRAENFGTLKWAYEGQVTQDVPTQNVAGRYDVQGSPFYLEFKEPLELMGHRSK